MVGKACPESDTPPCDESISASKSRTQTQGFSGDLMNLDSIESNGSVSKQGTEGVSGGMLSNRMSALTNTKK